MTKIEWTEKTWNPIVGCSVVSPGCTNCYAMKMAARIEAMDAAELDRRHGVGHTWTAATHYAGTTKIVNGNAVWTGKVALAPAHILTEPLRRKKPTMWFVNSMSDLFHESVPDGWIDGVFETMALSPQHTFQVLTKRSARMRRYFDELPARIKHDMIPLYQREYQWPLPNVWLGVSTEDQKRADERIPDLLATPAAVRFVSAEPLLGPVDFTRIDLKIYAATGNALTGRWLWEGGPTRVEWSRLNWVIVGGESGPGARPMHREWACDIVRQCKSAWVSCFVKQLGAAYSDEKNGVAGKALKVPIEAGDLISRRLRHGKGGDPSEWPEELRVREMPAAAQLSEDAA